jgi:hypothetical protein
MLFATRVAMYLLEVFPELSKFSGHSAGIEVLAQDKTTPGNFYRGLFLIAS